MKMQKAPSFKIKWNKGEKANESPHDPLFAMLMPSVLGILLCLLLLCGATWAWFSSTQTSETASIQAANYAIEVTVTQGETSVVLSDGAFTAEADTEYTVTLTAVGTASTGFGEVTVGEKRFITAQLAPEQELVFRIKLTSAATVYFGYQWGTSSKSTNPDITTGTTVTDTTAGETT